MTDPDTGGDEPYKTQCKIILALQDIKDDFITDIDQTPR